MVPEKLVRESAIPVIV